MKNFLNLAKLATLMMIFAIGFTQQGHAQRYLTERVATAYNVSIKEGMSNLHTFSNGIKLAVDRKGTVERIVAIDDKGVVYTPSTTTELSPFRLSLSIKTNRCTIKIVWDRSNPNRKLEGDINCDLTN